LPFSESAFASHGVGLPGSLAAGAFAEGVDADGVLPEWPPPSVVAVVLSFLSFEQPATTSNIAITKSASQRVEFDRSNLRDSHERIMTLSLPLSIITRWSLAA
jgi:hypothetical protein